MNATQIDLVQQTFAQAAPIADEVASRFYQRLFQLEPSLQPMFKGDMRQQGDKLMTVLAFVVRGLDKPETILDPVRRLGKRHVDYGVQSAHYATVGQALLDTLADIFGPAFTAEIREAWTAAYSLLASIMQEAAAEASGSAPEPVA